MAERAKIFKNGGSQAVADLEETEAIRLSLRFMRDTGAFDEDCAATYGRIGAKLAAKGEMIGDVDTVIAAHALTLGVTLVTHNWASSVTASTHARASSFAAVHALCPSGSLMASDSTTPSGKSQRIVRLNTLPGARTPFSQFVAGPRSTQKRYGPGAISGISSS